jgi:hypothetical protein
MLMQDERHAADLSGQSEDCPDGLVAETSFSGKESLMLAMAAERRG